MTTTADTGHQVTPQATRYHWIMSLQWPNGNMSTTDGNWDLRPGQSRTALYSRVREDVIALQRQNHPELQGREPLVLFFSFEPDELA
jgi:hypothetical protein